MLSGVSEFSQDSVMKTQSKQLLYSRSCRSGSLLFRLRTLLRMQLIPRASLFRAVGRVGRGVELSMFVEAEDSHCRDGGMFIDRAGAVDGDVADGTKMVDWALRPVAGDGAVVTSITLDGGGAAGWVVFGGAAPDLRRSKSAALCRRSHLSRYAACASARVTSRLIKMFWRL